MTSSKINSLGSNSHFQCEQTSCVGCVCTFSGLSRVWGCYVSSAGSSVQFQDIENSILRLSIEQTEERGRKNKRVKISENAILHIVLVSE